MRTAPARHDTVPLLQIPTLDAILDVHAAALGGDLEGYRNHVYRVANLCVAQLTGSAEEIEKIAVAAAFHDLGIWTNCTFDYLSPSANLARAYLTNSGRAEWIPEITETIFGHHKVSRYRGPTGLAGRAVSSCRLDGRIDGRHYVRIVSTTA